MKYVAIVPPDDPVFRAQCLSLKVRDGKNGRWVLRLEDYKRIAPFGLGDLVWILAKWSGAAYLARVYEKVTHRPCGCRRRRRILNKWLKFRG